MLFEHMELLVSSYSGYANRYRKIKNMITTIVVEQCRRVFILIYWAFCT